MRFFYSMILLMVVVSVNASEKKLRAKLEREYDLQLAQKQKEIESRKLLQSVARKHKNNNCGDQQKNIESKKKLEIKQQQKWQKNIKLRDNHLRNMKNNSDLNCTIASAFVISACFPLAMYVMMGVLEGVPIGCYYSGNICTCYYME